MIYMFFACAVGIFLCTVARSMPQLGLLFMLVYLPMNVLSGSNTPLESMPPWLATMMQISPSTHFVSFRASDPLSRRRHGCRLAAICLCRRRRWVVLSTGHPAFPLDGRTDRIEPRPAADLTQFNAGISASRRYVVEFVQCTGGGKV